MANPTYASTPPPFDPPDCVRPVYDLLTDIERKRLVKMHAFGRLAWSNVPDNGMQSRGLVLKLAGHAYLSPHGCAVAIHAYLQGVTA